MDKFQEGFCAVGCCCSGILLIAFAALAQSVVYQGECISFPLVIYGVELGRSELYVLGAICLGIQTHCYEIQKWLITKIVKAF